MRQQFVREEVNTSDKEGTRTISFVVNVYQDKELKIWVVSKEIKGATLTTVLLLLKML